MASVAAQSAIAAVRVAQPTEWGWPRSAFDDEGRLETRPVGEEGTRIVRW